MLINMDKQIRHSWTHSWFLYQKFDHPVHLKEFRLIITYHIAGSKSKEGLIAIKIDLEKTYVGLIGIFSCHPYGLWIFGT
ncbi:hypothetical protein CR513_12169, partial [Mucuna pruriens]